MTTANEQARSAPKPPLGAEEVKRSPMRVQGTVELDFRDFRIQKNIVQESVYLEGYESGRFLVNEPPPEITITDTLHSKQGISGLTITQGVFWYAGSFVLVEPGSPVSMSWASGYPKTGLDGDQWRQCLSYLRNGVSERIKGGVDLWAALDAHDAKRWKNITKAFGEIPDAVAALQRGAELWIRGEINRQPVRAANSALVKLANSGALGSFTVDDLGPLGLEVFQDALRSEIKGAAFSDLPALVEAVVAAMEFPAA